MWSVESGVWSYFSISHNTFTLKVYNLFKEVTMLNKYEWELYLKAGGQQVVDMFNRNLSENFTQEYIDNIIQFHSFYCPSKNISQRLESQLNDLIEECKAEKGTPFSFLANNDGLIIMFEDFIKQDTHVEYTKRGKRNSFSPFTFSLQSSFQRSPRYKSSRR